MGSQGTPVCFSCSRWALSHTHTNTTLCNTPKLARSNARCTFARICWRGLKGASEGPHTLSLHEACVASLPRLLHAHPSLHMIYLLERQPPPATRTHASQTTHCTKHTERTPSAHILPLEKTPRGIQPHECTLTSATVLSHSSLLSGTSVLATCASMAVPPLEPISSSVPCATGPLHAARALDSPPVPQRAPQH